MKILKIFNFILVLGIIIAISSALYLFFYRKIDISKDNVVFEKVIVDDISNVAAEKLNYDKVDKSVIGESFEQLDYLQISNNNSTNPKSLKKLIDFKDKKLNYNIETLNKFTPVLYSSNYEGFNAQDLFKELSELISENNLRNIILDTSLLSDTEEFYLLAGKLNEIETLNLGILLSYRTNELESYSAYKIIDPMITKILDISRVKSLADFFYIKTYDYTPINAGLPGPNSKLSEIEDIIQYYLYKGLDRQKIYLGINRASFVWEDRFYQADIRQNVIVEKLQSVDIEFDKSKLVDEVKLEYEDNYGYFVKDSKKYIAVYPSDEYIANLKQLALTYNLYGVFFRY